jgi:16S rRNA (cytosine1402-N4)-methyltransferase
MSRTRISRESRRLPASFAAESGADHIPVLRDEVMAALAPRDGATYVDGTFGAGGYSRAFLSAARCRVIGIDRDPRAVERAGALAQEHPGRFTVVEGRFGDMETLLAALGITAVSGIALDLGVSSPQLDDAARGFSFRADGPLDMRMSLEGESAADFINTADEKTLATVISRYGEEKRARSIARAIVAARPVATTAELANIVSRALGPAAQRYAIHPATRTFQALRIHVNDELGELERGLEAATRTLADKGRLVAVSFHSLEDRIVKQYLSAHSTAAPRGSRHAPEVGGKSAASYRLLTTRPRMPDAAETQRNPRARSARLRAAERLRAAA